MKEIVATLEIQKKQGRFLKRIRKEGYSNGS